MSMRKLMQVGSWAKNTATKYWNKDKDKLDGENPLDKMKNLSDSASDALIKSGDPDAMIAGMKLKKDALNIQNSELAKGGFFSKHWGKIFTGTTVAGATGATTAALWTDENGDTWAAKKAAQIMEGIGNAKGAGEEAYAAEAGDKKPAGIAEFLDIPKSMVQDFMRTFIASIAAWANKIFGGTMFGQGTTGKMLKNMMEGKGLNGNPNIAAVTHAGSNLKVGNDNVEDQFSRTRGRDVTSEVAHPGAVPA